MMIDVYVKFFCRMFQPFTNSSFKTFLLFLLILLIALNLECNRMIKSRDNYQKHLNYCKISDILIMEQIQKTEEPVSLTSRVFSLFCPENTDVSRGKPAMWWSIFPFTSALQLETIYFFHQSAVKRLEYVKTDAEYYDGYAGRILPPAIPLKCCDNGVGLPPLKTLYNDIFKRKPDQFVPDSKNRNLLFNAFYQYFVLQFFDTNSTLTVTVSQLYGSDAASERSLRSFSGGKLKTLEFNFESYAPNQVFTLRSNVFSKALKKSISDDES